MHATTRAQDIVDALMDAARQGTEAALRAGGALMRPQVHLLREELDQPYLGYVSSRPFYRGRDVVTALRGLGEVGSLTRASRLVVAWEHQDLCVALELPGAEDEPNGHVALDVHRDAGHVLRWLPFRLHAGPTRDDGCPTVFPEWGEPVRYPDVALPVPVSALLAAWRAPREWTGAERAAVLERLEQSGSSAGTQQSACSVRSARCFSTVYGNLIRHGHGGSTSVNSFGRKRCARRTSAIIELRSTASSTR
jgi:hypothetical protein